MKRPKIKPGAKVETTRGIPYARGVMSMMLPVGTRAYVSEVKRDRCKITRLAEPPYGEWWVDASDIREI